MKKIIKNSIIIIAAILTLALTYTQGSYAIHSREFTITSDSTKDGYVSGYYEDTDGITLKRVWLTLPSYALDNSAIYGAVMFDTRYLDEEGNEVSFIDVEYKLL